MAELLIRLQPIATDQIDAIRNRGENRVQASANRRGPARQIDNQARAARAGDLARKDCGWNFDQTHGPHEFAEAWQEPIAHRLCRLGRDVPRARPCAAGGEDERASFTISEIAQGGLNRRALVRHEPAHRSPLRGEKIPECSFDSRAALIVIDALRGPVRNRDDADGNVS